MNTALTTVQPRLPMPALGDHDIDTGRWRVLCETIFPSAKSPGSIVMALDYCRARNLDVFKRPVHIVPVWNSALRREVETVWPSINEIQITAARTNAWAGMDAPQWGAMVTKTFTGTKREDNATVDVSTEVTFPEWCAVTVYRTVDGVRCAFTEPVFWEEAYARVGGKTSKLPNDMWVKRPRGQLHKVAKAASLRAAFPEEADYTAEEMDGQDIAEVAAPVVPRVPEPPAPVVINVPQPAAPPLHDEVTGEIAKPQELSIVDHTVQGEGINWISFGQRYIAAIRGAATLSEADLWDELNKATLADMLANAPKVHARLHSVVSSLRADLFAKSPQSPRPDPEDDYAQRAEQKAHV